MVTEISKSPGLDLQEPVSSGLCLKNCSYPSLGLGHSGGGDASLSPDPRLVKGMPKNHALFVENEFPGLETEIDF